MRKLFLVMLLSFSALFSFAKVRVGIVSSSSSVPFAFIPESDEVQYVKGSSVQELVLSMSDGKIDILNLPVNSACILYNESGGQVVSCGITQNSSLFLVSNNNHVRTCAELLGKSVLVSGGSYNENIFRFILEENEIPVSKASGAVYLDIKSSEKDVINVLFKNKDAYAVLSQPSVQTFLNRSKDGKLCIDFQDEYRSIFGKSYYLPFMTCVTRRQFAEEHSEELNDFLEKLSASIEKVNENSQKASVLLKKNGLTDQKLSAYGIKNGNYVFIPSSQAKEPLKKVIEIYNSNLKNKIITPPDSRFFYSAAEKNKDQ